MSIFDFFRGNKSQPEMAAAPSSPSVQASAIGEGVEVMDLKDPRLLEFMRVGLETASGAYVSVHKAMKNMAVLRCARLISESIGMLPLNVLVADESRAHAKAHPVYKLLKRKPNSFQTAYQFKRLMQLRALMYGASYARIVWVGTRPAALIPLDPERVEPVMNADWTMKYKFTRDDGVVVEIADRDMFVLQDLSLDGVKGMSTVRLASEAIGLALQAEKAAARLFKNGMMVGGALKHPDTLSDDAARRLKESMDERHAGADNAGKYLILEEGMDVATFAQTAADSQHIENRKHQIEEVARAFGVPRPLLMMDDTSWGSGIEQLGIYFVQYTLAPWFTAWEQAILRSLFSETEAEQYYAKFNERALLRGTLNDQATFFSKALGAGGSAPWMKPNEVRDLSDLPRSDDPNADSLTNPMTSKAANEPANKPA